MTPTWTSPDGRIRLWHGDCLSVLPELEAGSFDAFIFDPPYGIRHTTAHGATWQGTQIAGDDSTALRDSILAKVNGHPWAVWGNWKVTKPEGCRGKIVWDKGPAFGAGDLAFPWKPSFEECWIGGPGWKSEHRGEGVWRGPCVVSWQNHPNGRVHPHQKPVWLFDRLITALPDATTICDPTCGSGTTAIACIRTGRRFIGVEIDKTYFDIARKRIEAELEQGRLFT